MSKNSKESAKQVINVTTDQAVMGAVIAQIRENYSMQKQELAEKMKLSPSAWSRVEKGETTLTAFQLRRITEIFDVPSDQIFKLAKEVEEGLRAKGVAVESSDNFSSKAGWLGGMAGAAAGAIAGTAVPVFGTLLAGLVGGIISYQFSKGPDKLSKEQ